MRIMMVVTTLLATMNMMQLKYVPMRGLSLVMGMISDTVFRNIVRDSRIVTPGQCDKWYEFQLYYLIRLCYSVVDIIYLFAVLFVIKLLKNEVLLKPTQLDI